MDIDGGVDDGVDCEDVDEEADGDNSDIDSNSDWSIVDDGVG